MTIIIYAHETHPQWVSTHAVLQELNIDYQRLEVEKLIGETSLPSETIAMAPAHQPLVIAGDHHWLGFFPNRLHEVAAEHQSA